MHHFGVFSRDHACLWMDNGRTKVLDIGHGYDTWRRTGEGTRNIHSVAIVPHVDGECGDCRLRKDEWQLDIGGRWLV